MSNATVKDQRKKTCFKWSRLLLTACLPLIFGVVTIIFTLQQKSISLANREQDQQQAIELRQQTIYDAYINDISKLLSLSFNQSDRRQLNYIGLKTVQVLRHLNNEQKRDVILFLYGHELIQANIPEDQRVNLRGADLTNVHFIQSINMNCELRNLYLPFVLASGIVFDKCDLGHAIFSNSWMARAKFIDSYMAGSDLIGANLTDAIFNGGNKYQINFAHSILVNSKFIGLLPFEANLSNADLLRSDLTDKALSTMNYILINTRFPNGSFSAIDSSELVTDGGAEESCAIENSVHWARYETWTRLVLHDTNYSNLTFPLAVKGKCYFRHTVSARLFQPITIRYYSLLINEGMAHFNLSAYLGCTVPNRNDHQVSIGVRCFDTDLAGPLCGSIDMNKSMSGFHYQTTTGLIPKGTVHFRLTLTILIPSSSTDTVSVNQTCFIDEVKLFICKKEKC